MFETAIVLVIVATVLIYVIRHYARVLRGESAMCGDCSQCCSASRRDAGECSQDLMRFADPAGWSEYAVGESALRCSELNAKTRDVAEKSSSRTRRSRKPSALSQTELT